MTVLNHHIVVIDYPTWGGTDYALEPEVRAGPAMASKYKGAPSLSTVNEEGREVESWGE